MRTEKVEELSKELEELQAEEKQLTEIEKEMIEILCLDEDKCLGIFSTAGLFLEFEEDLAEQQDEINKKLIKLNNSLEKLIELGLQEPGSEIYSNYRKNLESLEQIVKQLDVKLAESLDEEDDERLSLFLAHSEEIEKQIESLEKDLEKNKKLDHPEIEEQELTELENNEELLDELRREAELIKEKQNRIISQFGERHLRIQNNLDYSFKLLSEIKKKEETLTHAETLKDTLRRIKEFETIIRSFGNDYSEENEEEMLEDLEKDHYTFISRDDYKRFYNSIELTLKSSNYKAENIQTSLNQRKIPENYTNYRINLEIEIHGDSEIKKESLAQLIYSSIREHFISEITIKHKGQKHTLPVSETRKINFLKHKSDSKTYQELIETTQKIIVSQID